MEAIHNFVCEKEVCIEKVRAGLMHTMAELYELVGRSVATSIQRTVGDTFFSANYYVKDDKIMIYFYDELNPDEMTDFLMREKTYLIESQYVYKLVCRIQQRMINQFYQELDIYKKQHFIETKIPKDRQLPDNMQYKKLINAYEKAFIRRANSPYKRIRAK